MDTFSILGTYLLLMNLIGLFMIAYDKAQAKKRRWRVPELRFFTIGFLGGALGIYLGMKIFRHKTQHLRFIYGIPIIFILNAGILYYFVVL